MRKWIFIKTNSAIVLSSTTEEHVCLADVACEICNCLEQMVVTYCCVILTQEIYKYEEEGFTALKGLRSKSYLFSACALFR